MIGSRLLAQPRLGLFVPTLGWTPTPSRCDDAVGQIQQAINAAYTGGKLGDRASLVGPIMPLAVDGRAGTATQQALDTALPGWDIQMSPSTSLRQLRDKYGAVSESPFSCAGAPGSPIPAEPGFWDSLPEWAPAAAVALAIVGAAFAVKRSR